MDTLNLFEVPTFMMLHTINNIFEHAGSIGLR